jgi:phosphate transport system protein
MMTRIVDRELEELRELALRMGSLTEEILAKSLRALLDSTLCDEVQRDDIEIDRLDVAIDDAVLELLATKAPVATDLRFVLATRSVATDLERVGDISRNIAKSARRLGGANNFALPPRLDSLAKDAQRLLRKSLNSYANTDAAEARRILKEDDAIDDMESLVIQEAITELSRHPEESSREVDLIMIAKNLERVADHATNIAEDVILTVEARNMKHASKLAPAGDRAV